MKILVLNGPNLNLLGKREPDIYGSESLKDIMARVVAHGRKAGVKIDTFQSNDEGSLITRIGESMGEYDGLVINPAGYTHTSVAIRDAIQACRVPCVEVHLSNIHAREDFRHRSITAGACVGQISGFGSTSYLLGLDAIVDYIKRRNAARKG